MATHLGTASQVRRCATWWGWAVDIPWSLWRGREVVKGVRLAQLAHTDHADHIMPHFNEDSELVMSSVDIDRLRTAMAASLSSGSTTLLAEEIARAQVVSQTAIPPDVVTMNSRVKVRDAATEQVKELTLVYPRDANPDAGRVSVLAPVGSALLGLHIGQTIEWPLPGGRTKRITVEELCYQPESAGDYHL